MYLFGFMDESPFCCMLNYLNFCPNHCISHCNAYIHLNFPLTLLYCSEQTARHNLSVASQLQIASFSPQYPPACPRYQSPVKDKGVTNRFTYSSNNTDTQRYHIATHQLNISQPYEICLNVCSASAIFGTLQPPGGPFDL